MSIRTQRSDSNSSMTSTISTQTNNELELEKKEESKGPEFSNLKKTQPFKLNSFLQASSSLTVSDINEIYFRSQNKEVRGDKVAIYLDENISRTPILLDVVAPTKHDISSFNISSITELDVSASTITDDQLTALVEKIPLLSKIFLSYCPYLTDLGIKAVRSLTHVQVLYICGCTKISEEGLHQVLSNVSWKELTIADFSYTEIAEKTICCFSKFKKLEDLKLPNCSKIRDGGLQFLTSLNAIKKIDVSGCAISFETLKKSQQRNIKIIHESLKSETQNPKQSPHSPDPNCYFFLQEFLTTKKMFLDSSFLTEKNLPVFDHSLKKEITDFYTQKLKNQAINFKQEIDEKNWIEVERLLQQNAAETNLNLIFPTLLPYLSGQLPPSLLPKHANAFVRLIKDQPDIFRHLKKWDLSRKKITYFPLILSWLFLPELEFFNLSYNNFRFLPSHFLYQATELKKIWLNNNNLKQIPSDLLVFWPKIIDIDIRYNNIEMIPFNTSISSTHIRTLLLSNNNLVSFSGPSEEVNPNNKSLDIANTKTIRDANLHHLLDLDLSSNCLESPPLLPRAPNLQNLSLKNNRLYKLSPCLEHDLALEHQKHHFALEYYLALESLDISENILEEVPPQLTLYKNLVKIILSNNKIKTIPQSIEEIEFAYLKIVDLSRNLLSSLKIFFKVPNIEELYLQDNELTEIPANFFKDNPQIKYIDLSRNSLKRLDKILFLPCRCLQKLNLSHNDHLSIPDELWSTIPKDTIVDISGNKTLKRLPKTTSHLVMIQE